jgi:DNA topoisomerase I
MTAVALSMLGGEFPRPAFSWLQGLNSEGAAPVSQMIKRVPGRNRPAGPSIKAQVPLRTVMDNNSCAAFQQRQPVTLDLSAAEAVVDPKEAAEHAGLTYVSDERPGLRRRKAGKGFCYVGPDGAKVRDAALLKRIKSLAVPPAWTDVWICPRANGHIQATGRDARGRKQYRYHARFREVREGTKYHHMLAFAESLPAIRKKVSDHLALRDLPREKVLATVVQLLEATLIRVGSDEYARQNKSYGLTTLKTRHVEVNGSELRFNFKGKSGKVWRLGIRDRRIAKVIRACQDLPGQELFQYVDEGGETRDVTSSDVNAYLREISGEDITAKDFRTWHGTVLAAMALQEFEKFDSQAGAKKNIKEAIQHVAARLGNTPTICRKCYIHPEIFTAYQDGSLRRALNRKISGRRSRTGLSVAERSVLEFLRRRLGV